MNLSLEKKALAWALLAAALSMGSAWLVASPIEKLASSTLATPGPSTVAVVSSQLAAEGSGFFGQSCGDCHGDDAHGDEGPDLHNLGISNASIANRIRNGVKGEMPSFAKKYNDQQIGALVAYLRTLR